MNFVFGGGSECTLHVEFFTVDVMGISLDSPILSNSAVGKLDTDLQSKKMLPNGDVHSCKVLHEEVSSAFRGSPVKKILSISETEEFDDEESASEDEKVMGYAAEIPITKVDERDKGTSDDWIPRHPELVRLTGRHPFNCEPPLATLMEVCQSTSCVQKRTFQMLNRLPRTTIWNSFMHVVRKSLNCR